MNTLSGRQPRMQLNSTPIKSRPPTQQQNDVAGYSTVSRFPKAKSDRSNPQHPSIMNSSVGRYDASPSRANPSPKPNLPPSKQSQTCANHSSKSAQFMINLQGDMMYYCEKCSAHLASQGFKVVKLKGSQVGMKFASLQTSAEGKKPNIIKKPHQVDRYTEITAFCQNAKILLYEYEQNIKYINGLNLHYLQQQQLIEQFHNGMAEYLAQVKSQHLRMLRVQSKKYLQIADIERGEAEQNANELNDILHDIDGNMAEIVNSLGEDRYREVMNCYQQKLGMFSHQAEEMARSFEGLTSLNKNDLQVKLSDFSRLVSQFFAAGEDSQSYMQPEQYDSNLTKNRSYKELTERFTKLGKMTESKGDKGPFRNLFIEHELESPAFKQI